MSASCTPATAGLTAAALVLVAGAHPGPAVLIPHQAKRLDRVLRAESRLSALAADRAGLGPEDLAALNALCAGWSACLQIDQPSLDRLFEMWNAISVVGADEIGDWAFAAPCSLSSEDGLKPPRVVSVSATVFADGAVALAVQIETIDSPLSFVEELELATLEHIDIEVPA